MAPPLWFVAALRFGSETTTLGPVVATLPSAPPNHATTLCGAGVGIVKYTYTRCEVAKSGGNAMPSRPRSPCESTAIVANGVGSNAPFWTTRKVPPCSLTNNRPSGANAIAVGAFRPGIVVSLNPGGSVAAAAGGAATSSPVRAVAANAATTARTARERRTLRTLRTPSAAPTTRAPLHAFERVGGHLLTTHALRTRRSEEAEDAPPVGAHDGVQARPPRRRFVVAGEEIGAEEVGELRVVDRARRLHRPPVREDGATVAHEPRPPAHLLAPPPLAHGEQQEPDLEHDEQRQQQRQQA